MSGICGIVSLDGSPIDPRALSAMMSAAGPRGPDGAASWQGSNAAIGQLALNIASDDQATQQPVAALGLVLSADARIDNRDELIRRLVAGGHLETKRPSDARLLLGAYRCWGPECPGHIIGDYAFAVWDVARQQLFAARDPMGVRPFYFAMSPKYLVFASEITQLLTQPDFPARLEERMVGAFLTGQPMPLGCTFYKGTEQLPAAHALLVARDRRRVWRFWEIDPGFRLCYRSDRAYADHFRAVFGEAVRCRLRSAKPVGLMLSGGLDSGAIGATAGWLLQHDHGADLTSQLRAYCWSFERLKQCDERHISRLTTDHYHLPTTDISAEVAHPLAGYPEHGAHREEPPFGPYQALHEKALTRARAEGVTVMMTGYRGDLVAGESVVDLTGLLLAGRWRRLWSELSLASGTSKRLPKTIAKHLIFPSLLALWPGERPLAARRWLWRHVLGWQSARRLPDWLRPEFAARLDLAGPQPSIGTPPRDCAVRQRYETIFVELHMHAIAQSERTFAHCGVKFADPWSDRRLVECVLAMPQWRVHQGGDQKRLVRMAMAGIMPERARQTARKVPLTPLYHYALQHAARGTILNLISNSRAAAHGFVVEDKIRDFYEAVCRGERSTRGLWEVLALEMWLRKYWE